MECNNFCQFLEGEELFPLFKNNSTISFKFIKHLGLSFILNCPDVLVYCSWNAAQPVTLWHRRSWYLSLAYQTNGDSRLQYHACCMACILLVQFHAHFTPDHWQEGSHPRGFMEFCYVLTYQSIIIFAFYSHLCKMLATT